ncbi:hypothetical protein PRIPAC_73761, partial [Pristionchus pacificus]
KRCLPTPLSMLRILLASTARMEKTCNVDPRQYRSPTNIQPSLKKTTRTVKRTRSPISSLPVFPILSSSRKRLERKYRALFLEEGRFKVLRHRERSFCRRSDRKGIGNEEENN